MLKFRKLVVPRASADAGTSPTESSVCSPQSAHCSLRRRLDELTGTICKAKHTFVIHGCHQGQASISTPPGLPSEALPLQPTVGRPRLSEASREHERAQNHRVQQKQSRRRRERKRIPQCRR